MNVERQSFIPEIQESREVFEDRIITFDDGFLVFEDESKLKAKSPEGNAVLPGSKAAPSQIAGYFSSERWAQIPASDELFALGHSARQTHKATGKVLYITSFAILPEFRGHKIGKELFERSLSFILTANKDVQILLLLVNEEWKSAVKIYHNYGFEQVRKINGIFLHSAGIIMQKIIKEKL